MSIEEFKIDFSECRTRKDYLELLSDRMKRMPLEAAACAWSRLADSLDAMSHPERKTPRYWDVVLQVYSAYLHAMLTYARVYPEKRDELSFLLKAETWPSED